MNIWADEWDATDDWSGGGVKSKHLVDRGPLLLRGQPTLRGPEGDRQLGKAEVVHFPVGPEGAHGLRNETDELVRYIMAGIRATPEVVEYPDIKKITAQARTASQTGERLWMIHDVESDPDSPNA